jgi:hypothetical protein
VRGPASVSHQRDRDHLASARRTHLVTLDDAVEPVRARCGADEDEEGVGRDPSSLTRPRIPDEDPLELPPPRTKISRFAQVDASTVAAP